MKLKSDVVIQKVADFYVAVSVGARSAEKPCMLRLNESGAFLWNKCFESGCVDASVLSAALVSEYGIGEDIASVDAKRFVDSLVANELTEE